ncbi:DNA-3-methyladenine glycosylase family protein [Roseisalinus antarcticus]|uniref:DNA-3-methyladenine glycosylase II n=1 Tax=Roseisalinus antarcticus TaxID=254357 RepID=A0A1Y5RBQ0_9RHOB|nr:DNA-3-methyladenine glycosylase [Roseisalinus antarcticus]SLN13723.1 DNA-3-methyladenine glycosylase 2 [Roseisalinus antarcticus]
MTGRLIETEACVAEGAAWLAAQCPRMGEAVALCAPLPLRRKPDGFAELASAIVSQQVSTASAAAIWARCTAAGLRDPAAVRAAGPELLREVGLSRPKQRYLRALAEARLDYAALRRAPTPEVIATLTAVPGIGAWTAEIYAMFSLGRADVFAPGDLALQEGARMLYRLPERPSPRVLRGMAEAWSPWRSVAARALWAYYAREKGREGTR